MAAHIVSGDVIVCSVIRGRPFTLRIASIYNEHAEVLGAISIAGPSSRLPDPRIKPLGAMVAHIAEDVTRHLGGRWPHPR